MTKASRITELGRERCCSRCGEWWPDDREFYYMSRGKTVPPCKACYAELPSVLAKRDRRRQAQGGRS